MNKKIIKYIVIAFIIVFIVVVGLKKCCDEMFLCSNDDLAVTVLKSEPIDIQLQSLDETTYTYCRFLELKVDFKNSDYEDFLKSFDSFYTNHCTDNSRYAAFRSIYCDYEDLSEQEVDVLLTALQNAYDFDVQSNAFESKLLIKNNLSLQTEILYSSGHIFKAYEKKLFLDNYIEELQEGVKAGNIK